MKLLKSIPTLETHSIKGYISLSSNDLFNKGEKYYFLKSHHFLKSHFVLCDIRYTRVFVCCCYGNDNILEEMHQYKPVI